MIIAGEEPDIIMITEVIPKAQVLPISPALIAISGYSLYLSFDPQQPRLGTSGIRGNCIFVKESLSSSEVDFPGSEFQEQVWVEIKLVGGDRLLIGCLYMSPSGPRLQNIGAFAALLEHVIQANPSHLLITGDFNMPEVDWVNNVVNASPGHPAHKFLCATQDAFLFQHVTRPTRYRRDQTANVLDLIFSNEEEMVQGLQYMPNLGKSDHVVLRFTFKCYAPCDNPEARRYNFHAGDYDALREHIRSVDWQVLQHLDTEEACGYLVEVLQGGTAMYLPSFDGKRAKKNIYMTASAMKQKKKKVQALAPIYQNCPSFQQAGGRSSVCTLQQST